MHASACVCMYLLYIIIRKCVFGGKVSDMCACMCMCVSCGCACGCVGGVLV